MDEDVLTIAKEVAQQQGISTGQLISTLVRQALMPGEDAVVRNGVHLVPSLPGTERASLELVNRLRDDE